MYIAVNGVTLFFDVEGASLVPDGSTMREKPTLLLLHGGPGVDHTIYKPAFSAFTDIAQIVYLDHRGNGRSDPSSSEFWNLAQWADDVYAFCEALGIKKPIVYGASFGGTVAQAYATKYPDHPSKLILVSAEGAGGGYLKERVAHFRRLGGPEMGELAQRRLIDKQTDQATLDDWIRLAFPLYSRTPRDPVVMQRMIRRPEITDWFTRADGEGNRFNLLPELSRIQCPTLVMGGEDDPMTPIECQVDIAAAIPAHLVQFERFSNCGHGVILDAGEPAIKIIRDFINS
ncbi:MAG: alpha/beta hydrolase [Chloroflexota bacterium]